MAGAIKLTARVRIDRAKMDRYVNEVADRLARNAAVNAQRKAQEIIRQEDRIRTGAMHDGVTYEYLGGGHRYRVVSKAPYSWFQENGVRPFSASPGKTLAFMPKGGSTLVFAKSVKGFKGIHFMRRTKESLTVEDFLRQ